MPSSVFDTVTFHPLIRQWFKASFASPSPPQERGWPSIARGDHTLILAPTGSGKTLAAFLWSIDQLFRRSIEMDAREFEENAAGVHTLYISPLKALSNDIQQNLSRPLEEIRRQTRQRDTDVPPIRVAVRTGDTPSHVRRSMLRKPPHILITTPESFYLLLSSERGRELFRTLAYIIVDEIHAVCNNKRGVHLSLSLERMERLCQKEPIRIGLSATQKPLHRIAAYLGGQRYESNKNKFTPRRVDIIDCGQRRHMDLKVITPVSSFNELPESSVWPPVYQMLYKLIQAHKTTLVFAGMRAQTEKIARELNQLHRRLTGEPEAELALAHHGSISREARYGVEARLKAGNIPAVIATGSLELGIDIGSIDLVVQLEAPKNVSGALQRVGRSGHLLSATAKGRIIVLYPSDLDDAVAIARCMQTADIEETRIPQNALDVLAQQIVAEVAVENWEFEDLYRQVRQSYCYRYLPESVFQNVLEMLSGRFSDIPLQALKARLNWDRVNNRLIARRGSRQVAVLNGGTIPDRGYYGVYLQNADVKLGEVEEEFAFESRVGEVFFLGNSEWLIQQITPDRIIVTPVAAINPRAPFWKGDTLHRDYSTSKKIGRFRRELIEKIDSGQAHIWLQEKCSADKDTADNLVQYYLRQRKRSRIIATDRQLVAEWTIDSGGEPLLILHSPFGARVNGAWAIALAAALEQHYESQIQYSFDDDGILIRLPETTEAPPFDWLFDLSAEAIEEFLMKALPRAPVFLVHFRYNAARSLMLPRSHPGKRVPLWLQRLRASDLLQVAGRYSEFPVLIETYRECLQDVFDMKALKTIINDLNKKRIGLHVADTSIPSPMAAGILFKFVSIYLYEEDQSRQPLQGIKVHSELLNDILNQQNTPAILTPEIIARAERRWQYLDPQFQAASREDLFSIIEKLGPIDEASLSIRCRGKAKLWLTELQRANRILPVEQHSEGHRRRLWQVNAGGADRSGDADQKNVEKNIVKRVQRYLETRGPVKMRAMAVDLKQRPSSINTALEHLYQQKKVVRGRLIANSEEMHWCDRHNFTQLYRMAVAGRRSVQNPADRATFNRFLLEWHRLSKPEQALQEVIHRYRGYRFPLYFFEREILFGRYRNTVASAFRSRVAEFEELISNGDIIAHAGRVDDSGKPYVEFRRRGEGSLWTDRGGLLAAVKNLSAAGKTVFDFLRENGASYGRDLEWGTGLSSAALNRALRELAEKGLASCENYQSFLLTLGSPIEPGQINSKDPLPGGRIPHREMKTRHRPTKKSDIRKKIQDRSRIKDGRWFLTPSLAIMGKPIDHQQRADMQAGLLLHRYGILVKEWYRRESGLLPWHQIFQVLKRLEWQGEIRRGYFVSGLSGIQFALPQALELLDKINREPAAGDHNPILLSTLDPALPYGTGMDWGHVDPHDNPIKVVRSATNHLGIVGGNIVMYSENFFQRLSIRAELPEQKLGLIARTIREYLKMPRPLRPRNRIEVQQINAQPASRSPFAVQLIKAGFEKNGQQLVLWPSVV